MLLTGRPALSVLLQTYLATNESPGTRDFIMAADPVVDGFSWLDQVDLQSNTLTFLGRVGGCSVLTLALWNSNSKFRHTAEHEALTEQ